MNRSGLNQWISAEERFWLHVEPAAKEDCWLWKAARSKTGYGIISVGKKRTRAHRFSWEIHFGSIPQGLCVCHHCDVRHCVNPNHLFVGTKRDNSRDMAAKGRAGPQVHPASYRGERSPNARLREVDVRDIRRRLAAGESQTSIALDYEVGKTQINNIATSRTWSWMLPEEEVA